MAQFLTWMNQCHLLKSKDVTLPSEDRDQKINKPVRMTQTETPTPWAMVKCNACTICVQTHKHNVLEEKNDVSLCWATTFNTAWKKSCDAETVDNDNTEFVV